MYEDSDIQKEIRDKSDVEWYKTIHHKGNNKSIFIKFEKF